jgi:hypothetical protein
MCGRTQRKEPARGVTFTFLRAAFSPLRNKSRVSAFNVDRKHSAPHNVHLVSFAGGAGILGNVRATS